MSSFWLFCDFAIDSVKQRRYMHPSAFVLHREYFGKDFCLYLMVSNFSTLWKLFENCSIKFSCHAISVISGSQIAFCSPDIIFRPGVCWTSWRPKLAIKFPSYSPGGLSPMTLILAIVSHPFVSRTTFNLPINFNGLISQSQNSLSSGVNASRFELFAPWVLSIIRCLSTHVRPSRLWCAVYPHTCGLPVWAVELQWHSVLCSILTGLTRVWGYFYSRISWKP